MFSLQLNPICKTTMGLSSTYLTFLVLTRYIHYIQLTLLSQSNKPKPKWGTKIPNQWELEIPLLAQENSSSLHEVTLGNTMLPFCLLLCKNQSVLTEDLPSCLPSNSHSLPFVACFCRFVKPVTRESMVKTTE